MIALIGDVPLSGIEPAPMYMRNWKIMIGRMIITKRKDTILPHNPMFVNPFPPYCNIT